MIPRAISGMLPHTPDPVPSLLSLYRCQGCGALTLLHAEGTPCLRCAGREFGRVTYFSAVGP